MMPLADRLASEFRTVEIDWPGFGDEPRPGIAWNPGHYRDFLDFLLREFPTPLATVAAGHGAAYLISHAARHPGAAGRLCLLAPTWRGPLPTMMGRHPAFRYISRAVDLPLIGLGLYRLNVNRPMIRMMSLGHVYADRDWLSADRFAKKLNVTNAAGARHASFRFVAGELDPMGSREEFLAAALDLADPVLVVYGAGTPRRSKAEMLALAALPGVQASRREKCQEQSWVCTRSFRTLWPRS